MTLTDQFIQSELQTLKEKAVQNGDYVHAFYDTRILSCYLDYAGKLNDVSDETIEQLLDLCFAGYEKYYLPKIKQTAFELYKNINGEAPVIKENAELSPLQQGWLAMYQLEKNTLKEWKIFYPHEIDKCSIFDKAKEKLVTDDGDYNAVEELFYDLSSRLKYSDGFYSATAKAAIKWQRYSLPEFYKGPKNPDEKLALISKTQYALEHELDPDFELGKLARQVKLPTTLAPFLSDQAFSFTNQISIETTDEIRLVDGKLDENTLFGYEGSYLRDFEVISASRNSLIIDNPSQERKDELAKAILSVEDNNKRKGLQISFSDNKLNLFSCSLYNFDIATEIIVHESMHQHQHKSYFAYLANPEKAKSLSNMTDWDFKLGQMANIFYIRASVDDKKYHKNPEEKHAYAIQGRFEKSRDKKFKPK